MSTCRDGEELDSQGDASSQPDTISIASRTSQNTLDSDKVRTDTQTCKIKLSDSLQEFFIPRSPRMMYKINSLSVSFFHPPKVSSYSVCSVSL